MRIFKNKWFDRYSKKVGITDSDLKDVVADLEKGLWDADLGGYVYKKRIARKGEGKSGGHRAIIIFRSLTLTFFTYAYPKSNKDNIDEKELRLFKKNAIDFFRNTNEQIQVLLDDGWLIEIV